MISFNLFWEWTELISPLIPSSPKVAQAPGASLGAVSNIGLEQGGSYLPSYHELGP